LDAVWEFKPAWGNFLEVWQRLEVKGQPLLLLFRNTFAIAIIGVIGTLLSSIPVAYGFARFRIPGKGALFLILIATIILPTQVTLVPTYAFFARIGWTGTWLPLTVPHFFANAYNVFLLRQYFLTIPREQDEAAMIDGAGPLRTLISVILPQSFPAIAAVTLFHFFFAWNDFFGPMVYLSTRPELQPLSIGIQTFNALYSQQPHLIQSTALLGLALPVVAFFFAQRFFMQGVVITGVER
jgi:multiple sugar transport system permease protein